MNKGRNMRVTQSSYYNNLDKNNRNIQHELVKVNRQLASGKKIEYGHEAPSVFKDTMKLDNEIKNLQQAKDAAYRAVAFTDYTDTSLGDMVNVLERFKVKLVNAASDHNATASLVAIASELKAYKEHLMTLSNSTGDGKYLFAGTTSGVEPINIRGEYVGNEGELMAFLGNKVEQPYNITGSELFLGENSNIHRRITTNIRLFNQSEMHPEAMTVGGVAEQSREVVLTRFDDIRDLVGDDDENPENDESTFFYVKGRDSLGFTFKEKFELDGQSKVEDLLNRIGVAFGNTPRSKVVDISIDDAGFIQITDNRKGSSKIDFHMISSHEDVNNIDELAVQGANVQVYNNSEYTGAIINKTVSASNSKSDHRDFSFDTMFDYKDEKATTYTLVREAMPEIVDEIVFQGADVTGAKIEDLVFEVKEETSMQDLMDFIQNKFGGKEQKVIARMDEGRIVMFDNSIDKKGISNMYLSMTTFSDGDEIPAFSSTSEIEYDRSFWNKDGARLSSSIPQITREENLRADATTKISEVAGDETMVDGEMKIAGKNIYGETVDFTIHLKEHPECAYFVDNQTEEKYNIMSHGFTTGADEMTYQQLFDVIGMIMSKNLPASSDPTYIEDYVLAIQDSQQYMDVKFDQQGRITVLDQLNSVTRMEMSIYDNNTNDFSDTRKRTPLVTFHANNALTVDDPKIDFFELIDGAISAVELERKQPDGITKKAPRNIGVQNAMVSIDHLLEHVINAHSKNGSQSNAIRYTQERNEAWIVNAKGIQSEILDTDLAEASMKYKQLTNNYDAMLSTVNKVNNLNLVNYLK